MPRIGKLHSTTKLISSKSLALGYSKTHLKGNLSFPGTEVLKEKRGPTGEIETYRVRIVAGGHKQVEVLIILKPSRQLLKCHQSVSYLQMQRSGTGKYIR